MILLFCESGVLAKTREDIYLLFTKGEEEKVLNCDISFCLTSRSKLASEIAIFYIFYIIISNVHTSKFRQFFSDLLLPLKSFLVTRVSLLAASF